MQNKGLLFLITEPGDMLVCHLLTWVRTWKLVLGPRLAGASIGGFIYSDLWTNQASSWATSGPGKSCQSVFIFKETYKRPKLSSKWDQSVQIYTHNLFHVGSVPGDGDRLQFSVTTNDLFFLVLFLTFHREWWEKSTATHHRQLRH